MSHWERQGNGDADGYRADSPPRLPTVATRREYLRTIFLGLTGDL